MLGMFLCQVEASLTYQIHSVINAMTGGSALTYMWPRSFSRWWEVQFIGEGIIDQVCLITNCYFLTALW
jgi:hypothetical protein